MVDVGEKSITKRSATAVGFLHLPTACYRILNEGGMVAKGNVLETARLAGIMAAKRTAELIPLCHPLPLTGIDIDFDLQTNDNQGQPQEQPTAFQGRLQITATVRCTGKTGVEMEALTAVSVTGLTLYDMLKAVSHDMTLDAIQLTNKTGGKSGSITREMTSF